jgi:hypothetical protein
MEMNDCDNFRDRLVAYATGTLDEAGALKVRSHIASCESCAKAVRKIESGLVQFRALPAEEPSRDLAAAVMSRISSGRKTEKSPLVLRIWQRIPRFAFDAAVAASLLLCFGALIVPSLAAAKREASRQDCRGNLMQIGMAVQQYKDIRGSYPSGVFDAFLRNLRHGVPDLAPDRVFVCDVLGKSKPGPEVTDYRGPRIHVTESSIPRQVIAGDFRPNHGGEEANVVFFNGFVETVQVDTALWMRVEKEKDRR